MYRKMLRILAIMLVISSVLAGTLGCQSTPTSTPTPTAKPTTAPASTATPTPTPTASAKPSPTVAPIQIKYQDMQSSATSAQVAKAMTPWSKMVEEKTGGRVKFSIFLADQVVPNKDAYAATASGILDLTRYTLSYGGGRFPHADVISLPFAVLNPDQGVRFFAKLWKTGLLDEEFNDVKVLGFTTTSPYQLFTKKPVRTPADLKGLKIRTAGPVESELYKAWGAVPVNLSGGDVYESLSRGMVDGSEMTIASAPGFKLQETTKYLTKVNVSNSGHVFAMNKATFNKLPADIQKSLDEQWGAEFTKLIAAAYVSGDQDNLAVCTKAGMQVIELTAAEQALWAKPAASIWNKWVTDMEAAGRPGKKIVDAMTTIMKEEGLERPQ